MRIYKSVFPLVAVVAVFTATVAFPSRVYGDIPQSYNEQFPINYRVANVCGDINQAIQLDGTLHVNSTSVADPKGGFHGTSHANWQGVEGTNLVTGEKYRFISRGASTYSTNGESPFTSIMTTHNNMVGQDSGVILVMQIQYKITVNANGDVTTQSCINLQSARIKDVCRKEAQKREKFVPLCGDSLNRYF